MDSSQDIYTVEAQIYNALAHPARLRIIELLREGEACVCHIQAMLELRQAYISQHLNVLKRAGLLTSRKDGLRVYYRINDFKWIDVIEQVQAIIQPMMTLPTSTEEIPIHSTIQRCHCPHCMAEFENQTKTQEEHSHA